MKIPIHTFGTRGDVQPYLALGLELQARGHAVTLSAPRDFTAWIESFGLPARAFDFNMGDFLRRAEALGVTRNPLKAYTHRAEMIDPMIDACLKEAVEGTRDADMVIAHPKALFSASGAEAVGAGFILGAPLPIISPTRCFPMPGVMARNRARWLNALSWAPLRLGMMPFRRKFNALRKSLGLAPVGNSLDYGRHRGEPCLRLTANSAHILRRPDDWDDYSVLTGNWVLPETSRTLAPEIETFLQGGDPPVYVGFGSMVTGDATRLVTAAISGLRKAGLRGIIARGWAELPATTQADMLVIDGAPHDLLFPRCRLIVHHGGAGTTAAALTAGKASLVTPFMVDQPWWAERLREAGLGQKALRPDHLTAGRFARALRRLAKDEVITRRCAAVGEQLRSENGVAHAADLIERDAKRWAGLASAGNMPKSG
ncbi:MULTISPECIES: glycosyltransferase [Maricaulis]|uniref:Sterol 3beta-glucosyltransferase n=1 Tax=Maricaulis maris TaxID=74318 RepID=A0A495D6S4_9PROT|nr:MULTISPECIES: glycosyltransferase [Maricaulis]RKQ96660.1 sterol 3beta-glucosyltransferase [Maricaulis maris]